jgi:allophanate hydrolase subunit 2
LVRARQGELASEGMLAGALQVPPDGRPVILGPDGPVTGGYPVIATLNERSLSTVAQARPGTQLRFRHARQ